MRITHSRKTKNPKRISACRIALSIGAALTGGTAAGADEDAGTARLHARLEACSQVRVDSSRLACYDRFIAQQTEADRPASPSASPGAIGEAVSPASSSPPSLLDEYWELSEDRKRGTFNFMGYRPNYLFPLHVSSNVNRAPSSPASGHTANPVEYRDKEAKLQLSIRTKMFENFLLPKADLWFAYTQQSLWQLYSGNVSRPFRSTDHEPELIYVVPVSADLPMGWKLKMTGLSLAHQSNGQALPLSRSWNRVYAFAGIEKGNVAVTARYNQRLREKADEDDNPGLVDYRGRTELFAVWSGGHQTVSALWKTNFTSNQGSLQLDWTFPVKRSDPKGLRWYIQAFTGYGETLADYNFRQTSVGAGLTLFGW